MNMLVFIFLIIYDLGLYKLVGFFSILLLGFFIDVIIYYLGNEVRIL